jgi:hypothetical protein
MQHIRLGVNSQELTVFVGFAKEAGLALRRAPSCREGIKRAKRKTPVSLLGFSHTVPGLDRDLYQGEAVAIS